MAKYKRRRLIVDRRMQSEIITQISWPAALCVLVSTTLMGLFCARLTDQALAVGVRLDGILSMLAVALSFIFVSSGYFLFNCLKVSHRVAGPIYRMRVTLRAIRAGDPTLRCRIRQKDFLRELADEINEFLEWAEPHLPRAAEAEDSAPAEVTHAVEDVPSVVVEPSVEATPPPVADVEAVAAAAEPVPDAGAHAAR